MNFLSFQYVLLFLLHNIEGALPKGTFALLSKHLSYPAANTASPQKETKPYPINHLLPNSPDHKPLKTVHLFSVSKSAISCSGHAQI
jgi:hypothetical protein